MSTSLQTPCTGDPNLKRLILSIIKHIPKSLNPYTPKPYTPLASHQILTSTAFFVEKLAQCSCILSPAVDDIKPALPIKLVRNILPLFHSLGSVKQCGIYIINRISQYWLGVSSLGSPAWGSCQRKTLNPKPSTLVLVAGQEAPKTL